jgi:hypothetical protein
MATRTCQAGIYGRTNEAWHAIYFHALRDAGVAAIHRFSPA